MKGKLIIFEGTSGTGKETQAKLLQKYLSGKNITSQIVYHPSPELKPLLTSWREERNIDHLAEVYLLLADRYDRVRRIVKPALEKGEWVIGLRNFISALVYQGKTDEESKWIQKEFMRFEPIPDYLFYFDMTPQVALERIMKRHQETGEALGKFETLELLEEKRNKYLQMLRNFSHHSLDASGSIEQIHKQIIQFLLV